MITDGSTRAVLLATNVPAAGGHEGPRTDIELLGQTAESTIVAPPPPNWARRFENLIAADVRHVLRARALHPSVYVSFTERLGAPAVLLNPRARHICVAHNFNRQRHLLEKGTGWMRRAEKVIVVCRRQQDLLVENGVPADVVTYFPDYVDAAFFDPDSAPSIPLSDLPPSPFVLAVGQEQRDYGVLLDALKITGMKAVIVPSSSWVQTSDIPSIVPANVQIRTGLSFPDLRSFYAASAMVVVPVRPGTQYAAGVNGLLEALAMARPVIVTETPGLKDYMDSRLMHVVPAGDAEALVDVMRGVFDGASVPIHNTAGRDHVLLHHTVEAYVDKFSSLVAG